MSGKDIAELVSVIFSLLLPLIGFITTLVKVIKEKQWNILKSMLCDFMIKAENVISGSGEEKKKAVMSWCEEFCKTQGITFNPEQVSNAIEKLIDLTKKVNNKAGQTS